MSDLHTRTIEVLREIQIIAVDATLRATYQGTALESISAKARAILAEHNAAAPVSKSQAKRVAALEADARNSAKAAYFETHEPPHCPTCDCVAKTDALAVPLGPIDRDEDFDRMYIPLPGGWEVQTKGKGSSFRICDTKDGERLLIPPSPYLHETLERMAKEIHAACTAPASQPADQYIGKDDVWTYPSAGGEDARDADSVRVAPEHPANAVRRALLRLAETTDDEGTTDLPIDVLTGLVAFGYLTRRRAGRHGYFYEITPAGDAIVTGQAAAAMKETK